MPQVNAHTHTPAPGAFPPRDFGQVLPSAALLSPLACGHAAWLSSEWWKAFGICRRDGPAEHNSPSPHPVAAGPPDLPDSQGVALRVLLLGDPALVPLQSGSYLHLLEDVTALLLARRERLAWQGRGHAASGGEPHRRTLGFLSSPPKMPLPLCCPGSTRGPGRATCRTQDWDKRGPWRYLCCCLRELRYSWRLLRGILLG